jgi:hypothetical protein
VEPTIRVAVQRYAPLEFNGLIVHDAGATPPFALREVRRYCMRLGDSPHREDFETPRGIWAISDDYILADFDGSEHQSPRK